MSGTALIAGDGHSHALLGTLDAIAPAAAFALTALDAGAMERRRAILSPSMPPSRHIVEAPTFDYQPDIVFMARLNARLPADPERAAGGIRVLLESADAA